MINFALNISEDGRVLSATYIQYASKDSVLVESLPDGDISQYRYINGEYVYDPLPDPVPEEANVTTDDILNTLLGVTE